MSTAVLCTRTYVELNLANERSPHKNDVFSRRYVFGWGNNFLYISQRCAFARWVTPVTSCWPALYFFSGVLFAGFRRRITWKPLRLSDIVRDNYGMCVCLLLLYIQLYGWAESMCTWGVGGGVRCEWHALSRAPERFLYLTRRAGSRAPCVFWWVS